MVGWLRGCRVFVDRDGDGAFDSASEPSSVTDTTGLYIIKHGPNYSPDDLHIHEDFDASKVAILVEASEGCVDETTGEDSIFADLADFGSPLPPLHTHTDLLSPRVTFCFSDRTEAAERPEGRSGGWQSVALDRPIDPSEAAGEERHGGGGVASQGGGDCQHKRWDDPGRGRDLEVAWRSDNPHKGVTPGKHSINSGENRRSSFTWWAN